MSHTTRPTVLVGSIPSDSHSWNLAYLQLLLEEQGFDVMNLGPCTPVEDFVRWCEDIDPALVVVSSVNGHGRLEALRVVQALRPQGMRLVAGGMLSTSPHEDAKVASELSSGGFDAVFTGPDAVARFKEYLTRIRLSPGHEGAYAC
jgi:methylaspartate mutase sigma subunit